MYFWQINHFSFSSSFDFKTIRSQVVTRVSAEIRKWPKEAFKTLAGPNLYLQAPESGTSTTPSSSSRRCWCPCPVGRAKRCSGWSCCPICWRWTWPCTGSRSDPDPAGPSQRTRRSGSWPTCWSGSGCRGWFPERPRCGWPWPRGSRRWIRRVWDPGHRGQPSSTSWACWPQGSFWAENKTGSNQKEETKTCNSISFQPKKFIFS